MAARGDQRVDERVAVGEVVLHAVAGAAQRVEQPHGARRRVEPDRVADARVLGREGREHDRRALLLARAACASRAWRTARRASRSQRSRSGA